MGTRFGRTWVRGALGAVGLAVLVTGGRAPATDLDTVREHDPALGADPRVPAFPPRLKALWLEALARPEADLKRQAAGALARAHPLGMPGLDETVPLLVAELDAADAHPTVRLAVAHALIVLDARTAAPSLMRYARSGGADAARLVEPALARWDHAPMRAVWAARLEDPQAPREGLVLAVRAAGVVKLADAAPSLRRLALDTRGAGDVRLESARALAAVRSTGLEADARGLAADASPPHLLDRLVAASLLAHHRGPAADELLLALAADREPAVAAAAVGRLLELDPALLRERYNGLAKSPDSTLRHLAARGLAELKTPDATGALVPLLADPHLGVRVSAREILIRLAGTPPLRETVHKGAQGVLAGKDPRGLEQAAIVVGALRHEPAADRLVKLLTHDAGEVRTASAWALRRLALPATAGPIFDRVRTITESPPRPPLKEPENAVPFRDLEHLIEALGVLRHRPADAVLRMYLPKPGEPQLGPPPPVGHHHLRAAAVWSLGHIHAADASPDLPGALWKLLEPGDADPVRQAAVIALGRIKAKDSGAALRERYASEKESPAVRRAAGWALAQVTGEVVPLPAYPAVRLPWFLEPVDPVPVGGK